jgi:hypothetical protein
MQRLLPLPLVAAALASSAPAQADCTCRAQGRNFQQGQAVCLATPNGPRIATCGMVLNNSSWELSQAALRLFAAVAATAAGGRA